MRVRTCVVSLSTAIFIKHNYTNIIFLIFLGMVVHLLQGDVGQTVILGITTHLLAQL